MTKGLIAGTDRSYMVPSTYGVYFYTGTAEPGTVPGT